MKSELYVTQNIWQQFSCNTKKVDSLKFNKSA